MKMGKVPSIELRNARCLVCALLSARHADPEGTLSQMEIAVKELGAICVGRVLQRRGVSRSKSPGGASKMDQPLTRSLFGKGKVRELAAQASSSQADILVVFNTLTLVQRCALADSTGCRIFSFTDDYINVCDSHYRS